MTREEMVNIQSIVKRISAEADTTQDMAELINSELSAYQACRDAGMNPTMYTVSHIAGDYAVIGVDESSHRLVKLTQTMAHGNLISTYSYIAF